MSFHIPGRVQNTVPKTQQLESTRNHFVSHSSKDRPGEMSHMHLVGERGHLARAEHMHASISMLYDGLYCIFVTNYHSEFKI